MSFLHTALNPAPHRVGSFKRVFPFYLLRQVNGHPLVKRPPVNMGILALAPVTCSYLATGSLNKILACVQSAPVEQGWWVAVDKIYQLIPTIISQ